MSDIKQLKSQLTKLNDKYFFFKTHPKHYFGNQFNGSIGQSLLQKEDIKLRNQISNITAELKKQKRELDFMNKHGNKPDHIPDNYEKAKVISEKLNIKEKTVVAIGNRIHDCRLTVFVNGSKRVFYNTQKIRFYSESLWEPPEGYLSFTKLIDAMDAPKNRISYLIQVAKRRRIGIIKQGRKNFYCFKIFEKLHKREI